MKPSQTFAALVATLCLASFSAHAATYIESDINTRGSDPSFESAYDSLIQNNDLLTNATITSNGVSPDIGTAYTGINDGGANPTNDASRSTYFGNNLAGSSLNSNPVVTFTLDTSVNTLGYTLTSINSIYGWQNFPSVNDQNYTISYSTDGVNFQLLAAINYIPFDTTEGGGGDNSYAATDVTLGNIQGAVGVKALQFSFSTFDDQNGQMIREIDVDGTPTEAPEPTTWALLGLGALALASWLRFRKTVS